MIKKLMTVGLFICGISTFIVAQDKKEEKEGYKFTFVKELKSSEVNDQQRAGTCWSYATAGMIESEMIRMGNEPVNISEMFVVRKCYEEKAIKYVRMHGDFHFAGGGALNDAFDVIKKYGAMPQEAYEGLNYGTKVHTHGELDEDLKSYLDGVVKNRNRKLSKAWYKGYLAILDAYLGKVPEEFEWKGTKYTPRSFADNVVKINPDDYYYFTSFTHHPFYEQFALEVQDNWTWAKFNNIPIDEFMNLIDESLNKGYAISWASDISEKGFSSKNGVAVVPENDIAEMADSERLKWEKMDSKERNKMLYSFEKPVPEKNITQEMRQEAFDNYQTTDDHGMMLSGIAKDQNGTKYYYVKNSWGKYNDYDGFFYASETFVKYKTLSMAIHKDVIPKKLKQKLNIK